MLSIKNTSFLFTVLRTQRSPFEGRKTLFTFCVASEPSQTHSVHILSKLHNNVKKSCIPSLFNQQKYVCFYNFSIKRSFKLFTMFELSVIIKTYHRICDFDKNYSYLFYAAGPPPLGVLAFPTSQFRKIFLPPFNAAWTNE